LIARKKKEQHGRFPVPRTMTVASTTKQLGQRLPFALPFAAAALALVCRGSGAVARTGSAEPIWIQGAMVATTPALAEVCATANGCTGGDAFLSCAQPGDLITNITFASYGNPSECPHPGVGSCDHKQSRVVVRRQRHTRAGRQRAARAHAHARVRLFFGAPPGSVRRACARGGGRVAQWPPRVCDCDAAAWLGLTRAASFAVPFAAAKVEKLCLGKTNCTVATRDFPGGLPCSGSIASGEENVLAAAVCSPAGAPLVQAPRHPAAARRANTLRFVFSLDGAAVQAAAARVSAQGYSVLYCNGERVSARVMEPGRASAKHKHIALLRIHSQRWIAIGMKT